MKDDLAAGVTTSRCLGDRFYIDVTCKKAQKEGRIAGPKLVVSGIGMRSSHGHGYVGMPIAARKISAGLPGKILPAVSIF